MDLNTENNHSVDGHTFALLMYDLHTKFVGVYPCQTKSTADTHRGMQHYAGDNTIKYVIATGRAKLRRHVNYLAYRKIARKVEMLRQTGSRKGRYRL